MTMAQVDCQLRRVAAQTPQPQIMISAGDGSRYQVVAEVMTRARNAEIGKIGFDGNGR